ncbi:hypothetical protein XENOCAPTIV_026331, partial [Xenoophorus captivus]
FPADVLEIPVPSDKTLWPIIKLHEEQNSHFYFHTLRYDFHKIPHLQHKHSYMCALVCQRNV